MHTAKGYSSESSVRGKGRATGWILKLFLGLTDSAPHGENQAPSDPGWGMQFHTQSVTLFTPRKFLTDVVPWSSPSGSREFEAGTVLAMGKNLFIY